MLFGQEKPELNCSWLFDIFEEFSESQLSSILYNKVFWAMVCLEADVLKYLLSVSDEDNLITETLDFFVRFLTSYMLFEPVHVLLKAGFDLERICCGYRADGLEELLEWLLVNEEHSS